MHTAAVSQRRGGYLQLKSIFIQTFLYACVGWSEWASTQWLSVHCLLKYFRSSRALALNWSGLDCLPLHLTQMLQGTFHNITMGCLGTAQISWICQRSNENWRALLSVNTTMHTHTHTINYNLLASHCSWQRKSSILKYKENIDRDVQCPAPFSLQRAAVQSQHPGIYIWYKAETRGSSHSDRYAEMWLSSGVWVSVKSSMTTLSSLHWSQLVHTDAPSQSHLASKALHTSTGVFLAGKQTFNWNLTIIIR